jgi:titin
LSWLAPATDGGSAVIGYSVSVNRDGKTWQTLANVSGTTLTYLTAKPTKGQTWAFNVYARNISGISPTSESVSSTTATTIPGVVGSLSAVLSGTQEISIRWAGVSDNGGFAISGYTLESLSNGVWSPLASLPANVFTYTVNRGLPGHVSSFRVSATNALGNGPISSAASIMSPYLQASAPQGFAAVLNSATNKVDVGFTAPTELGGSAINYYGLQVTKDAGKTWNNLVSLPPNTLRYAASAPSKGQTWSYRVVAFTGFGASLPSSAGEVALANTVPGAMSKPSVSLTGTSDVLVRWSPVADTGGLEVAYNLERQVDGIWVSVAQLPVAALNYTTSRPGPGESAIFRVSATNNLGSGLVSAAGSVMTPYVQASAPQSFSASLNTATNKVDVNLAAPANLGGSVVRGHTVQISKDSGITWSSLTSLGATTTSASVSAPAKGQTLTYRLISITQFGGSLPSSSVAIAVASTVPAAPRIIGASLTITGNVSIRWYAPTDNGGVAVTGYKIQKANGSGWVDVASSPGVSAELPADLPGTRSSWRVIAVNAVGDSVASSQAIYAFPAVKATAVQNVTVVAGTVAKTIQLSYVAPSYNGGSAISYSAFVSRDSGLTWALVSSTSALTVRLSSPLKGVTWLYKVVAVNSAGAGEFSSVVSYTGN